MMVANWFLISNMYLAFYFIAYNTYFDEAQLMFHILRLTYITLIMMQFVASLGSSPRQLHFMYLLSSLVFGLLIWFTAFLTVEYIIMGDPPLELILASTAIFLCYVTAALLHGDVHNIVMSLVQYLFMLPTYVRVLVCVYDVPCCRRRVTRMSRLTSLVSLPTATVTTSLGGRRV
jgi:chitin synthase